MDGHILLCPNPHRDTGLAVTLEAVALLRREGFAVKVAPLYGEDMEHTVPAELETVEVKEGLQGAALMITFGGDGTILQAAAQLLGTSVPVLGVNLGHMGFLTELEKGELHRILEAAKGDYDLQARMMLDAELIRGDEVIIKGSALNDVTINGIINMVRLSAYSDGERVIDFSGDGLIVATPTGATGYSLSAGGPLVEPDTESILLTPICAHTLSARCVVLSPTRRVTVFPVELDGRRAVFSIDGTEPVELRDGDEIRVRRSSYVTWMAQLKGKSFYETAFAKLSD